MTSTKASSLDRLVLPKHVIIIYSLITSPSSSNASDNTLSMLAGNRDEEGVNNLLDLGMNFLLCSTKAVYKGLHSLLKE